VSADDLPLTGPQQLDAQAAGDPGRPAVIDGRTGLTVTYRELADRSARFARVLRSLGVEYGGHVAVLLENRVEFFEVCWGAHRAGAYYTAINSHLRADEVAYIVDDCGATVVVVGDGMAEVADALLDACPAVVQRISVGSLPGYADYQALLAGAGTEPLEDEREGERMLYSSGTTGRPKGVLRPLTGVVPGLPMLVRGLLQERMGLLPGSVFLVPAPLYHAAPIAFAMGAQRLGATIVITGRFDAEETLSLIERYRATHGLFVPTNFVRLLRLPEPVKARYDLSSMRCALHGAAPCPVDIKRAMIDWWGPVLLEYYAGTEGAGMTVIDSPTWLAHPGSVGTPVFGAVHVVDEAGAELPAGTPGAVYFEGGVRFEYHHDEAKTAASYLPNGWNTLGDIGYLTPEGFLHLTDRRAFMIISGGVNIYPQEAENVLAAHPAVADVAVFGVPDEEMGEQVKAVVEPVDPGAAGPALAAELMAYVRQRLASYKCPRSIDFRERLPRADNGKLYKQQLRAEYIS
jgi:acyl-CoA synthetase (AMP-forming)/AMP-acid ligase II